MLALEPDGEEWRGLMRLVRWHLAERFATHPYWDDLLAEGYLAAWQAVQRVQDSGTCELSTAATRAAMWRCLDWLRRPSNPHRSESRGGVPLPEQVPLVEDWDGEEGPDIGASVVERLALEAQAERLLSHPGLSALQRALLVRVVMEEEPLRRAAAALSVSRGRAEQALSTALALLRKGGEDEGEGGKRRPRGPARRRGHGGHDPQSDRG